MDPNLIGNMTPSPAVSSMKDIIRNYDLLGPKGDLGNSDEPQGFGTYVLTYCDITFKVRLRKSTFEIFESATCINGDELGFVKVIDEDGWLEIRKSWSSLYTQRQAHRAFENGGFEDE